MSDRNNSEGVQLKRTMNLPLLIMFGLAFLAPTVVFNYYGIMTKSTGGLFTLSFLITTVVMIFTGYSYVQMVKAYPQAGSAYTYVARSVQPHLGFFTGWVMLIDYLLEPMSCYLLVGLYVNEYFPALPIWVVVIICVLVGMLVNIIGIRAASIVDTLITCGSLAVIFLFIIFAIKFITGGGGEGTLFSAQAIFNPETFAMKNTLAASAILCTSFLGFDAITTLAEETKNPEKVMGKAVMGVVIGAGVAFMLVAYLTQLAWPNGYQDIVDENTGIFELFPKADMAWLGNVFFVVDNLSSFVCALAGLSAVSRILYGMGRDNILPKKFFGKLSARFQTPVNNIVLCSLICMSALFYQDDLMGACSLVSFGAITGFFMVNLSVICHYYIKKHERGGIKTLKYLISPLIGMATILVVFFYLETSAKILGICWLAVGMIYLGFKTKGFKTLPPEMSMDEE